MIVVLTFVALAGVALRIVRRQMHRAEALYLVLAAFLIGLVFVQCIVADGHMPEKRYWIQASALMLPWAVWLVLRVRRARVWLAVVILGLAINDIVLMTRGHIPGSNKNVRLSAIAWAAPLVKADYSGPSRDATGYVNAWDYHRPNRPVVASPAQLKRLAYDVGGRPAVLRKLETADEPGYLFGEVDAPDYIFGERGKQAVSTNGCELMAARAFHGRTFEVWRCPSAQKGERP